MGFLRWLLAISVLSAHSEPLFGIKMLHPVMAVKIFFVISGFYMGLVLSTKYKEKGYLKSFYLNRIIRLYPTYLVILIITIMMSMLVAGTPKTVREIFHLPFSTIMVTVITNVFIFGQDLLNFTHTDAAGYLHLLPTYHIDTLPTRYQLIGQAWALGLECTFYLMAPFFVRMKTLQIILIAVLLLMLRQFTLSYGLDHDPWNYRLFPFELPLFLTGIILYRVFEKINTNKKYFSSYVALLPLFLLLLNNQQFCGLKFNYQFVILFIPLIFLLTKNSKIDRLIGEFSYPIYIAHFLIKDNLYSISNKVWLPFGFGGGLFIYTMLFAIPLILLDRYCDRWRRLNKQHKQYDQSLSSNQSDPAVAIVAGSSV